MSSVTNGDLLIVRLIRWICFIPTMFCVAFCSGMMFIPLGYWGTEIAILLSALAGIVVAPRYRILATLLAFLYGNYLYAKTVDDVYAENLWEFLSKYIHMVPKYFSVFVGPTIITLIVAIILDTRTKRLESEYLQHSAEPRE